jgi:ribosome maturation factor RimP
VPVRKVEEIITPSLDAMGYRVVRVRLSGGDESPTLQVMVETLDSQVRQSLDDGGITADHCADVSRTVSALLDVEDPIPSAYVLEVSSPGIDRPLTAADDFRRFSGFDARLEAQQPIDGRKRFKGKLLGLDTEDVKIETDTGTFSVPVANIATAKLLMTDDLIKQTAMARPQG